jgi:diguanylate cyclase (GGDEF)-like protein
MKYNRFFASFVDSQVEKEFLEHERESALKYLRPGILVLGILFFLFVIPDYFLVPSAQDFRVILIVRSTFLLLVIFFFIMLGKKEVQTKLRSWISFYAITVSASYLIIIYRYGASGEASSFFVQSLAVVVLILIFFSLESHWLHMVVISLFLSAGFLVISYHRWEDIPMSGFSAVIVYFLIALTISSISAYRINFYARIQFINRRELKELSEKDALTGIYNRSKFDAELNRWLDHSKRYRQSFAVVMLDIDNLKNINDLYGHITGDRVLKEFAGIVQQELRSSDIFARWGGDEFILLLPYADLGQACSTAERIRDAVQSYRSNQVGIITCSFGVAEFEEGDSDNAVVQRADSRLYKAKEEGKNRIVSE